MARPYRERRTCLGWPEVGTCERNAQTEKRHRSGRWSPRYCRECDELRLLHAGGACDDGDEPEERTDFDFYREDDD